MLSPKQTKFHMLRYVNICSSAAIIVAIIVVTRRQHHGHGKLPRGR